MACLRAIVKVLRQLRLEVGTGTGDEMLTSATRQFNKYMGSLLGSLEIIGEIAVRSIDLYFLCDQGMLTSAV